jgi:hypothetical protein
MARNSFSGVIHVPLADGTVLEVEGRGTLDDIAHPLFATLWRLGPSTCV